MTRYKLSDGLTPEERLRKNKYRGRTHERQSAQVYREMGYEVTDLDDHTTGYDFKIRKRDNLTGRLVGPTEYVECKAGRHSELSPRQREMQDKKGRRYRVKRNEFW
jgi:hypothetical protein